MEAALEANHMSCYVEKKLRKENMQKYMLPSAASRLDKVAGTPEALKTFEVPQDQFSGKVAECTPVDNVPAMAGRIGRRGVYIFFCSLNWNICFCFFLAWLRSTGRGLENEASNSSVQAQARILRLMSSLDITTG